MKALEILKNCRERGQKRAGRLELDEAIAELKQAMKPKTCDGCKYQKIDIDRCDFCKRYYSDQYEPKDNA